MSELVLVTGANGFIGRHLVRELLQGGYQVRAVDRSFENAPEDGAERIETDILDAPIMQAAMDDVKTVYHLAALTSLWMPDESAYQTVNVEGTRTVLQAALDAKADRFVHCSSFVTAITGSASRNERSVADDDIGEPADLFGAYARSKRRGERVVMDAKFLIDTIVVMPSAPIGAGDHNMTAPTGLLRDLINGNIPATLDQVINFIDVQLLAKAIVQAGEKGQPANRYLLCGKNWRMADFLNHLEQVTGIDMPKRQVPFNLALIASFVEEKILCKFLKRPPKAPFSGVRFAGRKIVFDATKAQTSFDMDLTPLDDALIESLSWLSKNGHLNRSIPALEGDEEEAEQETDQAQE